MGQNETRTIPAAVAVLAEELMAVARAAVPENATYGEAVRAVSEDQHFTDALNSAGSGTTAATLALLAEVCVRLGIFEMPNPTSDHVVNMLIDHATGVVRRVPDAETSLRTLAEKTTLNRTDGGCAYCWPRCAGQIPATTQRTAPASSSDTRTVVSRGK